LTANYRWYKTRKPKLALDILGCLALRGKSTKGMIESVLKDRRHGDILDAFSRLEEKRFIKKVRECKFGRGRKQYYYKITQPGLALLITDDPVHPLKFWKALLGYCHHSDQELT